MSATSELGISKPVLRNYVTGLLATKRYEMWLLEIRDAHD